MKSIKTLTQILFTIGIFYYIFSKFKINLLETFANINWWYVLMACMIRFTIMPIISMNRWKLFLKETGVDENIFSLFKISLVSQFIGIVLPSSQGSDVVRMYYIEKIHGKLNSKSSSVTVLIERIIGLLILAFLGLLFALICNYPQKMQTVAVIACINTALWIGMFVLNNKWCYNRISRLLNKSSKFKGLTCFLERLYYSFITFPFKKVLLSSVILILTFQLCTIVVTYLIFMSFGVELSFLQHLAFYPIITILSIIPISISGLGLREGFFVYFYSLVGIASGICVSVSLINYFIEVVLYAAVGGIIYALQILKILK